MNTISLGGLILSVPYLHRPKTRHTWHYRRVVPSLLKQHYSSAVILKSLHTKDEAEAAKLCLRMNKRIEDEFDRLSRGLPKELAPATYELAIEKLRSFDIYPDMEVDEGFRMAMEGEFLEHIEDKLRELIPAREFEQIWYKGKPVPERLLGAVDSAALDIMRGQYRPRASDYINSYVHLRERQADKKFVFAAERAIAFLLEFLPDRPPGEYKRADVRLLIKSHLEKAEMKTATLHRQLTVLRAMFNLVSREHELRDDRLHPFTDFTVPNLREDAVDRRDFTTEELTLLRQKIAARQPLIESLVHLMLETGLRVKECCGLKVSDLGLDADIPYVQIQKNPFRPLKTKSSKRYIPLVGVALAAMKTAIEGRDAVGWVFSTYIDESNQTTKNAAASAAANKRIRSILGEDAPTCHSFRHTFNSRLRNVECPRDIRDELGGWANSVSDRYGSPADIKIKQDYLLKSIDAPSGVEWA